MRPLDLFRFSVRALRERKLRAVLTIIGIVIGPATIVALVGATQGYSNASTSQFSSLGATALYVSPVGRGFSLTSSTVTEIQGLDYVSQVLPYQQMSGQVTQGGGTVSVSIIALNLSQINQVFPSLSLNQGSLPTASDTVGAVLGNSIAYPDIKDATNASVDSVIAVSDIRTSLFVTFSGAGGGSFSFSGASPSASSGTTRSFVVRGIYNSFGQGLNINPDDSIFIQLSAGEQILHKEAYTGLIVLASSPKTVTQVEDELTSAFGEDIRATAVTSLLSTIESTEARTATLLEAVAATSVAVAFIGIMTTMFTTVLERTTEIGLLKALGESSRGILFSFIAEAAFTGFLGGAIGAGVGVVLSFFVISALSGTLRLPGGGGFGGGAATVVRSGAAGFAGVSAAASSSTSTIAITPAISPELILLAMLLATFIGTLGGLMPAWRASRLTPVEALHRS
jgi:putative ABC transport system permease protein